MREIPVVLLGSDGTIITDPIAGVPCIRVSIAANFDGTPQLYSAWALLDTGADNIFVDKNLSDIVGAEMVGSGPVHSATEIIDQPIYNGYFFIENIPVISTEFSAVPLPVSAGRYHIVLGRAFLRLFDFRFDRQTQAFSLVWSDAHSHQEPSLG